MSILWSFHGDRLACFRPWGACPVATMGGTVDYGGTTGMKVVADVDVVVAVVVVVGKGDAVYGMMDEKGVKDVKGMKGLCMGVGGR